MKKALSPLRFKIVIPPTVRLICHLLGIATITFFVLKFGGLFMNVVLEPQAGERRVRILTFIILTLFILGSTVFGSIMSALMITNLRISEIAYKVLNAVHSSAAMGTWITFFGLIIVRQFPQISWLTSYAVGVSICIAVLFARIIFPYELKFSKADPVGEVAYPNYQQIFPKIKEHLNRGEPFRAIHLAASSFNLNRSQAESVAYILSNDNDLLLLTDENAETSAQTTE